MHENCCISKVFVVFSRISMVLWDACRWSVAAVSLSVAGVSLECRWSVAGVSLSVAGVSLECRWTVVECRFVAGMGI